MKTPCKTGWTVSSIDIIVTVFGSLGWLSVVFCFWVQVFLSMIGGTFSFCFSNRTHKDNLVVKKGEERQFLVFEIVNKHCFWFTKRKDKAFLIFENEEGRLFYF